MQPQQNFRGRDPGSDGGYPRRRRLGLSGMTWMWIGLAVFFAMGVGVTMLRHNERNVPRTAPEARRSYFGVDGFQTTDGGVTFDVVELAGGPADKAGLVGGDIITSLDGHAVTTSDEAMDILRQTPIGKSIEVIYTRDGNSHKTQLTTISADDFNRLRDVGDRPNGMFGFETDRTTRISEPDTRTFGLRLDHVQPNSPADLFGIKEGDILTDFDRVPIRTSRELLSRVRRATPGRAVEVVVLRDGQARKIPVTMGRFR